MADDKKDQGVERADFQDLLPQLVEQLNGTTPAAQEPVCDEARDEILAALLGLALIDGVGFITLCRLFDEGFFPRVLEWDIGKLRQKCAHLTGKWKGDLAEQIHSRHSELRAAGAQEAKKLASQKITFLPKGHESYPKSLHRLETPPRWIFTMGCVGALRSEAIVAVVGTRNASERGLEMAYRFSRQLVRRNAVVLSGLARGIDEQAHLGAVDYYGQTIAVLGHGMFSSQTQSSKQLMRDIMETDGAIISEYLPWEHPSRDHYLRRNELQVALSRAVVPVECPDMASGTGATIRRAEKIKTEVIGVVPGNLREPSLVKTKENLEGQGHRVFAVTSNNSHELWSYLETQMPEHDWEVNQASQQDRFLRTIERGFLSKEESLALDDAVVDRLSERLKARLGRSSGEGQ